MATLMLSGAVVSREPMTLAEWLQSQIDKGRVKSEREIARRIGVSADTINRIGNGEPTGMSTLDKLAEWAGVPVEFLVGLMPRNPRQQSRRVMMLKVYARVSAGRPSGAPSGLQPFEPPYDADDRDRWLCFEIAGDCLASKIEHGDRVVVDKKREPKVGDIVVVDHDGELMVKRVVGRNGRLTLEANNGITIIPNGDTTIVGVAVQVVKPL